jgi:hypothetical protein
MIKPDTRVIKALAASVRAYPEILEWIEEWRMSELERLPQAVANPTLFQGRCQVLNEVADLVKSAPAFAAKL